MFFFLRIHLIWCDEILFECLVEAFMSAFPYWIWIPSLKLLVTSSPLKINGWKLEDEFPFGMAYSQGLWNFFPPETLRGWKMSFHFSKKKRTCTCMSSQFTGAYNPDRLFGDTPFLELTYLLPRHFWVDEFFWIPGTKVRYVSFVTGRSLCFGDLLGVLPGCPWYLDVSGL